MDALDELTQSQKDILSQYQAVTQSDDLDASIARLADHNWNLERAIQSLYDGTRTTREKLEEEVAASTRSSAATSSSNNASPPIPPRPARRRFGILSLLTWPFGFAWNISWAILTFASRFFARPSITSSHSSSTQRQDSRTVAARFLRNFETKYGETHVDFFQGGYSQALEIARRELRFLLVILQSDEHDDTPKFCSETLTSNELIDWFRQNNILVWGGNVADAEAYQVSNTLQATTYPFMAIIALQSLHGSSGSMKMSVVDRIEGPATPSIVIRRFENAMQRYGTTLNRMRLERDQREMERRLRQEQDQAYRESLRADQEKERKAREEREAAARAEEEARRAEQDRQLLAEKRKQHIRYLCKTLPAEPDASYQGQVAKLSFRLADGERVIRKFRGEESLETLYQFVESYPFLKAQENVQDAESPEGYTHKYNFTIISPYPRTVYQADKEKAISEEKGLWPSATLIVDAEDEEDGDE